MGKNWKTTVFGLVAILLGVAGPVLTHYVPIVGLDWTTLCTTLSTFAVGGGLLAAKDSTTHSTEAQVMASSDKAEVEQRALDAEAAAKPAAPAKVIVEPPTKP